MWQQGTVSNEVQLAKDIEGHKKKDFYMSAKSHRKTEERMSQHLSGKKGQ